MEDDNKILGEIVYQYILIERSKDWLESQINYKVAEITLAEESGNSDESLKILREQLKTLYFRCSFEKRQMDNFIQKYGYAIPSCTGAM